MSEPLIDLGPIEAADLIPQFAAETISAFWQDRAPLGPVDELLDRVRHTPLGAKCPDMLAGFTKALVSRNRPATKHQDKTIGYTLIVFLTVPQNDSGMFELIDENVFLAPPEPRAYLIDTTRPHRVWPIRGERLAVVYYRTKEKPA